MLETGSDFKFVAEISPPVESSLVRLESENDDNNPEAQGDIEMGPLLLQASFSGLQRYSQNYRVKIYTVLEGREIAGVTRDIQMPEEPLLYQGLYS